MARAAKRDKPIDFEAAMRELEELVEKLEQGEYSLEDSIKQFERGIELTRQCQQALNAAEQKVQKLSAIDEDAELEPFSAEDQD